MSNHLFDALFATAADDDPFAELPAEGGRTVSYGEARARVGRMAAALRAAGVNPEDRVALQAAKSLDTLLVYLATVAAGGVFLPLNTAYTPAEVGYFITDAAPAVFLCDAQNRDALTPVAADAKARLLTMDDLRDAMGRDDTAFEPVPRHADDLAAILYTSGTTGRSKGAMMSHGNLLSNARALVELWQFTPADRLLHALPIFHTHGLFVATNVAMVAGSGLIFLPGFDVDTVLDAMPRATAMMGVPTFYTRLLDDERMTADATAHMRLFVSGSAPMLVDTHRAFEARTGMRVLERYGMTETNMITSNPFDGDRRIGTVGPALPGQQVRIVDAASGEPVETGTVGSIETAGPNVFSGYWNMPEKTAEEFRPDGFFITGDLGTMDADGYVTIVGRSKDLVISGGYNIYPKEIESVLDDEPGVRESAVFGVPHPDFGEGLLAAVVPDGPDLDVDALTASLGEKLARFKQPKAIFVMDALPRNTMGKVQKVALREAHADHFKA